MGAFDLHVPIFTLMDDAKPAPMVVLPDDRAIRRAVAKRGANPEKKRAKVDHGEGVGPGRAPPATRNWKTGEYKPSLAMRLALDRAHAEQPPLIGLTSPVRKEFNP